LSPIDIVYLWVDGADPAWRARRQQAYAAWTQAHDGKLALHGNVAGRYRDNGELRYNLRALEKFFPGHGHIYLLTDRQVPAWLRASARLSVIDHASLMPAGALPVFDSGHIESYLHQLPGLSEQFLYFNDDVFLGAPFEPALWFGAAGDGLSVFTESAPAPAFDDLRPDVAAPVNCATLSRHWLSAKYVDYVHAPCLYAHAPRPMLKSQLHALEALAPEMFAGVRQTVFRAWQTPALLPDLVPRWMVYKGYARQQTLDPLHIASGADDAPLALAQLVERFGELPFFCINDTCDEAEDDDPRLLRVAATLQSLLPQPSSFEKAPASGA
jgi:hypothetical protein